MNRPRAKAAISLILAASLVMPQSVWAVIARAGSESTETLVDSTSSDASGQPDTIEEIYQDNLPASVEPDSDEYDGLTYKLKDSASRSDVRSMERRIAALDPDAGSETDEETDETIETGESVETVVEGEVYRADSLETIEEVAEPDNIEYIEPDYIRSLAEYSATPDDSYFDRQKKALELHEIPKVWEQGYFGSGDNSSITVAVIDTGVSEHPDLKNVLPGRRFLKGEEVSYEGDIDKHGTMVAGIIGALDEDGVRAVFSNYGSKLYVAAPRTSIASTKPSSAGSTVNQTGEYGIGNGTSLSTPFISALAAMAKSVDSEMTPSEFESVLNQTAYDLGDPGFDIYYGWACRATQES